MPVIVDWYLLAKTNLSCRRSSVNTGLFLLNTFRSSNGTLFALISSQQWPNHCKRNMKREKTMNKIKGLITVSAFSLLVLCLPAIALAQYGNPNGGYNNGGYGNNGGYNNGQYGNNGNYGDIRSTVRDLKDASKRFEKVLDRSSTYSKQGYGGYGGYNDDNSRKYIRKLADKFKDAADRLDDKYGNGRNINNSYSEANKILDLGSQLEQSLNNYGMDGYMQNEWNRIQNDLRIVANTYNSNYNGGYNRNNRNNRNGGYRNGRNNLPSWWPF